MTTTERGKATIQQIPMKVFFEIAKGTVADLSNLCSALLPARMTMDDLEFDICSIKDDCVSKDSFLLTPDSKEIFDPLVERVWKELMRSGLEEGEDGDLDEAEVEEWLGLEQEMLKGLSKMVVFTSGYPARAFQLIDLRYQWFGNRGRNLFQSGGVPVLAWPKQKGAWRKGVIQSLWALPAAALKPLYLYLAVVRPITIRLLKKMGRPTAYHASYLFVHSHADAGEDPRWTTGHFNLVLSQAFPNPKDPGGFQLHDRGMRQLFHAIIKQHLPMLFLSTSMSSKAVDRQGCHRAAVSSSRYGQFHSVMKMSFSETDECFGVSQVMQALIGVGVLDERWRQMYVDLPMRLAVENRMAAMDRCRVLIGRKYGVPGVDKEATCRLVEKLLKECPFLGGDGVIGDEVLEEVMSVHLYGNGQPRGQGSIPVGGYEIVPAVDGILTVSWTSFF
jgi:hypothetical protein